ncbi:MAG: hypothetical protein AB2A00_28345 [Myxococcota bacterium]
MSAPESKAQALNNRVATLRTLVPAATMEALLAALPPDTAEILRNPPLAVTWLPSHHWARVVETAHKVVFAGDDAQVHRWGRTAMLSDLSTVFRLFLKLASPQFIARRASNLWDQYNRNHGRVHSREVDGSTVEAIYEGVGSANASFWLFQRGVVHAAVEASGVKDVEARIVSGGGASPSCTIRVSWRV